jgi:hypothetical protein
MISLSPENIKNFGEPENAKFCLLTTPKIAPQFQLITEGRYSSYLVLPIVETLESTIEKLEENVHVLVIAPEQFIQSVNPEKVGRRKIAVMATNSTPTSILAIKYFITAIEQTDPQLQQQTADYFFDNLVQSKRLTITNPQYQTKAHLELNPNYEWHEQLGKLCWGQQQIFPSGEISVLPLKHGKFDPKKRLQLNGKIVFDGRPIVHTGQHPNRVKQAQIFAELEILERSPLIATIKEGSIVKLEATHPQGYSAITTLESLFQNDRNYSIIWELGFGINTSFALFPGNLAMNEVFGGDKMVLHIGLGLTPATEFHVDLLCPSSQISVGL